MSLIHFHRFLVTVGVVFCVGYAGWEFDAAMDGAGAPAFVLGTVFALLAVGLTVYLANLKKFLGYDEGPTPP